MKRNWYAIILLGILAVVLYTAGYYIDFSTQKMQENLQAAYKYAEEENYPQSCQTFKTIAKQARSTSQIWLLLVRRSLVDQLNQTLATIPSYVSKENLADLAVETARACAQVEQIRQSFFSWF